MRPDEILGQVRDTLNSRQVFGEPVERDGVVVVPVARVRGGGGGGGGAESAGSGDGSPSRGGGGGAGLEVRPVGVYVIRGDEVSWQPAVDVTQVVLRAQAVAVVALLVARSIARMRARRRRAQ